MPIVQLIILLAVIGLLLWLVNTYVPMAEPIKRIINIVVIICVVLWLLNFFGLFDSLGTIRTGHSSIR